MASLLETASAKLSKDIYPFTRDFFLPSALVVSALIAMYEKAPEAAISAFGLAIAVPVFARFFDKRLSKILSKAEIDRLHTFQALTLSATATLIAYLDISMITKIASR